MTNDKVDLSEFNLLIATPIGDGRIEDDYATSLDNTKQLIRQYGGRVENYKTKYISDISLARNKLFGAFRRNDKFTHMLSIDSDQSWEPVDVVWLLLLKRDFIAAVSCKKCFPPQYAFTMMGDNGKETPLIHEVETNVASIPYVGGAFTMISRDCAERMASSYLELQYRSDTGDIEHGVYDPMIVNDAKGEKLRRLSDDYAFCRRWRDIGGKVEAKMDINLGHTGAHRFSGSLYDHIGQSQSQPLGGQVTRG